MAFGQFHDCPNASKKVKWPTTLTPFHGCCVEQAAYICYQNIYNIHGDISDIKSVHVINVPV